MKKIVVSVATMSVLGTFLSGCGTGGQQASNNSANANQAQGNTASSTGNTTGAASNTASTDATGSKKINITWLGWTEDVATTYLWKDILESKGYKVTLTQLGLGPMFAGLSNNNANIFLDAWLPSDSTYVNKYKSKLTSLGVWYTGNTGQGVAVPSYMKNINTFQDLNQHASEFQDKIVGIEPGSQENKDVKKMIKVYGANHIKLQESSTTAMLAAIQSAYQQHKPVAAVMWTPHWAFVKYHLKYLKDPKHILSGQKTAITMEANATWAKNNPQVVKWFNNFKLNEKQLASLEEALKGQSDKGAAAKKWIAKNQSLVNGWLQ